MSDRSPRFRSVLNQFAPYKPGRRVANAQGQSFKLASNESPYGPLPSVAKAITAAAAEVNWYPDNTAEALTEAIARRYGVPPGDVALVAPDAARGQAGTPVPPPYPGTIAA